MVHMPFSVDSLIQILREQLAIISTGGGRNILEVHGGESEIHALYPII
jgi:hypothetical protein